jgi:hypothetical protein
VRFTYTKHAEDMLSERTIDRRWVEKTVLEPAMTSRIQNMPTECARSVLYRSATVGCFAWYMSLRTGAAGS